MEPSTFTDKIRTISRWLGNRVRATDMFGKQVSLTFHGSEKFKTHFGGVLTLTAILNILIYTLILFVDLVNREQSVVTDNLMHRDLNIDSTQYNIGNDGIRVGMAVMDRFTHTKIDDSYFDVSFYQEMVTRKNVGDESVSFS